MKKLLLAIAFFYSQNAIAQSPGLTVHLKMDSVKADGIHFKIEMKMCEPVKKSAVNGYFTNDKSTIEFKKLTEKDITCKDYIPNYKENYPFYHYYFSNQVFAWEKIIVWKISASTRDWKKPMYIIMPVKIKSFVTFIEINNVAFEEDKFIWIDEDGKIEADKHQHFKFSLKNINGVNIDSCSLKKILN